MIGSLVFLIVACGIGAAAQNTSTGQPVFFTRYRLLKNLFTNYDETVRGVNGVHESTAMDVTYTMMDIRNPEKDILEIGAYISMSWKDLRLTWDPALFGGVDTLYVDCKQIWLPDLTLFSQARPTQRTNHRAVVTNDGTVHWVPQEFWTVSCMDFLTDKRNVQCIMTLGSWTYNANQLNITAGPTVDLSYMQIRPNQNITSATVKTETKKYSCCKEEFQSNVISILMQRQDRRGRNGRKERGGELPEAIEGLTDGIKDLVGAVGDLAGRD